MAGQAGSAELWLIQVGQQAQRFRTCCRPRVNLEFCADGIAFAFVKVAEARAVVARLDTEMRGDGDRIAARQSGVATHARWRVPAAGVAPLELLRRSGEVVGNGGQAIQLPEAPQRVEGWTNSG